jgi:hypothetical protein
MVTTCGARGPFSKITRRTLVAVLVFFRSGEGDGVWAAAGMQNKPHTNATKIQRVNKLVVFCVLIARFNSS